MTEYSSDDKECGYRDEHRAHSSLVAAIRELNVHLFSLDIDGAASSAAAGAVRDMELELEAPGSEP